MELSIIVPAFNEEEFIFLSLTKVTNAFNHQSLKFEIIIINDGSNDNTSNQIKKFQNLNKSIKTILIQNNKNLGKSASVHKGIDIAKGKYTVIHDGDLEYDPKDLVSMLNLIKKEDNIDSIYGSRYLDKKLANKQKVIYYIANKLNLLLFNLFFQSKLTDLHSCYKLFKTKIIKNFLFTEKKFGFELEVTTLLIKNHFIIKEIPIKYQARDKSLGKKINFMDEISFLISIFKFRFFS